MPNTRQFQTYAAKYEAKQAPMARDAAAVLHWLTPRQMAEEITRLDALLADAPPMPPCQWRHGCAMSCCPEKATP